MKKIVIIIALIMAVSMTLFAGCGSNPYSAEYKEATEIEAQELSAKLDALCANALKIDTKTTGESNIKGNAGSKSVEFSCLCNYSHDGKIIFYSKITVNEEFDSSFLGCLGMRSGSSYKGIAEVWFDEVSGKLYTEYSVKITATGYDDESFSNKGTMAFTDAKKAITEFIKEVSPKDFKDNLNDNLGVSGNKYREGREDNKTYFSDGDQNSIDVKDFRYIIIGSDTEFQAKHEVEAKSNRSEEGKFAIETVTVEEKVSLPDEKEYTARISGLSELQEIFREGYGLFEI